MSAYSLLPKALDLLVKGFEARRTRDAGLLAERNRRAVAIDTVMKAVLATKAYLYDVYSTGEKERIREIQLSQKWQEAAQAIKNYDTELFDISKVKALGWADPREWDRSSIDPSKIKLDLIIRQCEWLQENEG